MAPIPRASVNQSAGGTLQASAMISQSLTHATLVFGRICAAPVGRVFAAFADPVERASWSCPSGTAAFVYDQVDFREGSVEVFRRGDKSNPQYRGVTRYYDIVPNQRIMLREVVVTQGSKPPITMSTATFAPKGAGTKVIVTAQLTSMTGDNMLDGAKSGYGASLDNLVEAMW